MKQKPAEEPFRIEDDEICEVRRICPTETSRLQGFPDNYTKIDGPETTDAPQYKAHGNSWATPCANYVSVRSEMELRRLGHKGTIRYATCCSGIEAHSVAVKDLDWKALFFSEIEPFPCRVLAKHYPTVPNLGDMTQIRYDAEKGVITNKPEEGYSLDAGFLRAPEQEISFKEGEMEVFSGGTPCQSVSVAGRREGMAENSGTRSSLAFHFQRIIDESKPVFTIWENVCGALSSNGGKDFLWFVNRCAESGYAMAWRVLDAQYVMTEEFPRAVPQRRRRIWMVGYRGNDWRVPVRILFEKERDLGAEPPERVPGLGFKTLFTDVDVEKIRRAAKDKKKNNEEGDLFSFFAETAPAPKILKVSQMIPLEEMPDEADFSRVPLMELHDFVSKVGTPTFIGTIFRQDKKTAMDCLLEDEKERLLNGDEDIVRMYENIQALEKEGKIKWEGAELINPGALEDIGNAGIVANGRICLLKCHEWTSGIQLSPTTHKAWEEVMKNNHLDYAKANALLPAAYDETVCGLSDVLVDDPDPKYNLSWRACYGILRRAVTRGKLLPMALKVALMYTLRESAGVVKWVALNGRDTAKEGCESERAIAKDCYDKYIEEVIPFDKVEAVAPSRASAEDSEDFNDNDEEGRGEGDPEEEDNEGFGVFTAPKKEEPPADAGATEDGTPYEVPSTEDVTTRDFLAQYSDNASSGVLTAGTNSAHKGVFCGRETSPNIVASQYKGPGNTQDGTIVGHVYKATE